MTTDELFAHQFQRERWHDVLVDIEEIADEVELTDEYLRKAFDALPPRIQDMAHMWGLSDTLFRDDASEYAERRKDKFIALSKGR